MRRKTLWRVTLRIAALLALCLLAGGILAGASTAGPPPGPPPTPPPPPPPPPPEPTPPPPEVYPCVLTPDDPAFAALEEQLRPMLQFLPVACECLLPNGRRILIPCSEAPLDDYCLVVSLYDSEYFKTFIFQNWQGIQALLKFDQLQRGAFIGAIDALAPFQIIDRGQCIPHLGAARSLDDGDFLGWMANAQVLGIRPPKLPPELIGKLNWFMAVIRVEVSADGKIDIRDIALVFYPDARYHSPEEMLKAARSLDDGGILAPLPPETATD